MLLDRRDNQGAVQDGHANEWSSEGVTKAGLDGGTGEDQGIFSFLLSLAVLVERVGHVIPCTEE